MSLWSIVALAFVAAPALAAPVAGRLSITGSLMLTATTIDFLPSGGGSGAFSVESFAQTGTFAPLASTTGTIKDLTSASASLSLANFLTLAADPSTTFTLTSVDAGLFGAASCGAAPAPGQMCTLPGSPFNLVNTLVGSTLSFTLRGNALNGADSSPFVGTVTTQFSGLPYQSILAALAGGSVSAAYSADFRVVPSGAGADLAISKTDGVQNVQPGGTTVYTIVVTNLGPNPASSVSVTDTFATSITSVSWTCSASFGSCGAASGTGDIATTVSLSAGGAATFVATATLSPAAIGTLTNTADVAEDANAPDPDLSNNSASDIDILGDILGAATAPVLAPAGMLVLVLALLAVAFFALRYEAH